MKYYCRFCAEKRENLQTIFDAKLRDNILKCPATLAEEIYRNIEFLSDAKLPNGICQSCLNTLKLSYDFYNKIQKSQHKLNEILNQQSNKFLPILLPKEIKNSDSVLEHKLIQSQTYINRIYQCFECSENFKSLKKLNGHIKKLHTKKNICIYCNCFYPENEITNHIQKEHKNLKYFCRLCSTNFSSQRFMFKHLKHAHNFLSGCFYCTKCDYLKFSVRENLLKHIEDLHTIELIEILPKETNNEIDIDKNEVDLCSNIDQNEFVPVTQEELIMDVEFLDDFFLNQDENSFQFNDCWEALGLNFEDELKLKFSDLTNDSFVEATMPESIKNDKLYKCPRCNHEFSSQNKMFVHLAEIHNENCLMCNECGLKFNDFNEFVQHRKVHIREFVLNPQIDEPLQRIKNKNIVYECKNCNKIYNLRNNYLIHICSKTTSKAQQIPCNFCNNKYWCTLCDKHFKTLPGLKYHLKTHEGIKSFVCPYCNFKFLATVNLNAHIKAVHAIKKSHLCDLCDRRFATLDHLKKHVMSVHQKERNHLCSICGSCFSQVSHLKQHAEIHKEKRSLQCQYCSKGFTRRIDMRKHLEKVHSIFLCKMLKLF